jgi:hypothetical protein
VCAGYNEENEKMDSATQDVYVYLDTGVTVEVPANLDPDSDEWLRAVKEACRAKFRKLLDGDFDVCAEPDE